MRLPFAGRVRDGEALTVTSVLYELAIDARKALRNPYRLLSGLKQAQSPAYWRGLRARHQLHSLAAPWVKKEAGLRVRTYGSYEQYVRHQASKLPNTDMDLTLYEARFEETL